MNKINKDAEPTTNPSADVGEAKEIAHKFNKDAEPTSIPGEEVGEATRTPTSRSTWWRRRGRGRLGPEVPGQTPQER